MTWKYGCLPRRSIFTTVCFLVPPYMLHAHFFLPQGDIVMRITVVYSYVRMGPPVLRS